MEQYDSEDPAPLTAEEVDRALISAVKSVSNRFYGYVDWDDLKQVGELARLETPQKFEKLAEAGNYTGVWQEFNRKCTMYAQKQKASALGYRPEDLFFYSKKALREFIPVIIHSWQSGDLYEFEYSDRALWMDIDKALRKLDAADLQIIRWAFEDDTDTVAHMLSISEGAASMRVSRLLDKLREGLGGENPAPRRKSLSNAASQAQTRNQWDGDS